MYICVCISFKTMQCEETVSLFIYMNIQQNGASEIHNLCTWKSTLYNFIVILLYSKGR